MHSLLNTYELQNYLRVITYELWQWCNAAKMGKRLMLPRFSYKFATRTSIFWSHIKK